MNARAKADGVRRRVRATVAARTAWTVLALLTGLLTVPVLAGSPAGAATQPPRIFADPGSAAPGTEIRVTGQNFPVGTDVQVQICGNNALDGSGDCNLVNSQEVATTTKGLFELYLVVADPPKPCPCVVMAIDFSSTVTPTTPFVVIGFKTGPTHVTTPKKLQIEAAALEGHGPWTSWFGTSPRRTLVLTIHNPNQSAYTSPPLQLGVGNSTGTTTKELTNAALGTIGPDQTRTYRIPVTFPDLSIGEHHVVGILGNASLQTRFKVSTWLFPWGLLVLVIVLFEVIALAVTRGIRRRRGRRGGDTVPESPATEPRHPDELAFVGSGGSGDLTSEGFDPHDPTWQLE